MNDLSTNTADSLIGRATRVSSIVRPGASRAAARVHALHAQSAAAASETDQP